MAFDLGNLLQQYAGQVTAADPDGIAKAFQSVAGEHPQGAIAQGIMAALNSSDTPPFSQLVSQLFTHSNPSQQTSLVNLLLDNVSPAMLQALAGSVGNLLSQNGHPQMTPEQVAEISPPQVAEIAATAEQHNGGIVERVASFFAEHPAVFNALDSSVLKSALNKMSQLH